MKLELLSFVLPFSTSSPMIKQAAVATCVPSGCAGTGVVGKVGGGEFGLSEDIVLAEELSRCLAIESVLCEARNAAVFGRIEVVAADRDASVLVKTVFECSSRRAERCANGSMHPPVSVFVASRRSLYSLMKLSSIYWCSTEQGARSLLRRNFQQSGLAF